MRRQAIIAALLSSVALPAYADYVIRDGSNVQQTIMAGLIAGKILPFMTAVDASGTYVGTLANPWAIKFGTGVTLPGFATPPTVNIGTAPTIAVTGTFWPYTLGQQLNSASVPVVLPASQITQLTPPTTVAVTQSTSPWVVSNGGTFAVQNNAATPAGTNLIGKVGIDQTTPGTTNGVSVTNTVPVTGTFWQATQPVSNAGTFATQATQAGTWNITNISGTVSLPTGAATSASQTTGNTSLSSIDGKTPALGQAVAASSSPVVLPATQITSITQPYQWTAAGAMQTGLAITTATTLTVPGGTLAARICVRGGNANYSDDGSTVPNGTTTGAQLLQNQCLWEQGAVVSNFKAIQQTGNTATLDVSYFK